MPKRKNCDVSVGGWGCKLLNLCCDTGLLILNGRMPSDKLRQFTCLANGGRSTIDYIIGSPAIWQVTTHFEVIIDDTRYCVVGGDSDHRLLHLRLSIDCTLLNHNIRLK
jgi:hypothetical protein